MCVIRNDPRFFLEEKRQVIITLMKLTKGGGDRGLLGCGGHPTWATALDVI